MSRRENHGLVAAIPREDMTFVRSKFLLDKKEEYKDDEELSKFLMSDKSDEYKYSIMNLLETDYSKCTYDGPSKKNRERIYNKELAIKLNEVNFKKFNQLELMKLAKNLWVRNYSMPKQKLIEQIELVKKQPQK